MNTGRKISGGKYHRLRKKKFFERDSQEKIVALREPKRKTFKVKGGNLKTISLSSNIVNIAVKGKIVKTEIKNVTETPQNIFLARQNRLMKGAIIDTPLGKARITNRPTQEGMVNAVLVKKE